MVLGRRKKDEENIVWCRLFVQFASECEKIDSHNASLRGIGLGVSLEFINIVRHLQLNIESNSDPASAANAHSTRETTTGERTHEIAYNLLGLMLATHLDLIACHP